MSDLTRRGFLGTSAAAAAYAAAPARARSSGIDNEIKVGLIGCGGRGTGAALQALHAAGGGVVLTAMADALADRVEGSYGSLKAALEEEGGADGLRVAPDRRFHGLEAWRKVVDSDVDVVLLCTPPGFRPVQLAGAVAAGKHVFCEKPMAVDGPGVRSVIASAEAQERNRKALVAGFCWRYNVRHRQLFQRVRQGAVGDIRAIYTTYLTGPLAARSRQDGWSDMEYQLRNWQHFLWLSGDHVVEQAVHMIDQMSWAMGDVAPERVWAMGGRQWRGQSAENVGNIYDHFSACFEYPGGVKAFHQSRQQPNCPFDNTTTILGSKGQAYVDGWKPDLHVTGPEAWAYEGTGEENDMYQQEHDELFASVRAGKPVNDGAWMARSTLLAIMLRMSAYTGQAITYEQALNSQEKLGPETWEFGAVPVPPVPVPGVTRFL
ncbi:MAG: Gfo/Idh/MocA family oxidoreductase [Planctomycetota bacterium]|nr:MAG: Gfo/Idh/MocA family oxidoreductase [Planctomycetota bacterium]